MFCSKCGKTLTQEAANCPHCGAPVGDSRFEGNGYTAAQPRFTSAQQDAANSATPYTRTTYTSMPEDEEQGADVYSRTTYRPVLKDSVPPAENSPVEDSAPADGQTEEVQAAPAPVNALPEENETDDDIVGSVVIAPLKPIKKTGISPEVQQYIRRMNEQKAQKRKGLPQDEGEPGDEALDKLAAESIQDETPDAQDAEAPTARRRAKTGAARRLLPGWVKPATIIVCVAVILMAAAYALIISLANPSQLEDVGYNLRADGIKLIKTREESAYRTELIRLVQADQTLTKLDEKLAESHDEIQKLLPESPMKNDQLFVKVLDAIQDTVDSAAMTEALAVLNKNDSQLATLQDQADEAWAGIHNSIMRLEEATITGQLQGIIEDTKDALATPAPTVTPEPTTTYKTLKLGMNNNKAVKKLQQRLAALGWFKSTIDSDYGPVTVTAVKRFKEAAGITPVDGVADPETQAAIFSEDAPRANAKATAEPETSPTLSSGDTPEPSLSPPGDANGT